MTRVHTAWILAFLAAGRAATAQDPSDAIFDQSQIRTFRLFMPSADWTAIVNADGETWRRADFEWVGPNGVEAVGGVGVKASGHGTLTRREKQSIRISFNEFEFDALKRRWRNVNRLKLDSMEGNLDTSMSRDRIAYWLMNAAGNAAPRLAHCKLYVNGAYKGVYLVVEPVRKDFLRYRWGADDDGNLFEQDGNNSSAYDWRGTDQNQYVPDWFVQENADAPHNYSDLVGLIDTVNNRQGDDRRTRLQSIVDYPVFIRHLAV
ncbi:MAG TPA: CotH kinase family protein, partial [Planctomycetota bacterium]|nr:CotH kinase family protein [Planctomycetota bacterium]